MISLILKYPPMLVSYIFYQRQLKGSVMCFELWCSFRESFGILRSLFATINKRGKIIHERKLLCFKKASYETKPSGQHLTWTNKTNCISFQIVDPKIFSIVIPNFLHDFSRKMLLVLFSINLTNFIV